MGLKLFQNGYFFGAFPHLFVIATSLNMLHENVKFYFKVISPIETHYITRKRFSIFVK